MAKENKEQNKKSNPLMFLLFGVVIPLILVLVITVVVLSLVGVNVSDWVKDKGSNIPVVSSFITSDEEEKLQAELDRANDTVVLQAEEIEIFKKEIESLEAIREDLEMDMLKLENRSKNEAEEEVDGESAEVDEVRQAAASFRKMDAESAAQIIRNLEQQTAIQILANLPGEVRGNILAEMEPGQAAELIEELTN